MSRAAEKLAAASFGPVEMVPLPPLTTATDLWRERLGALETHGQGFTVSLAEDDPRVFSATTLLAHFGVTQAYAAARDLGFRLHVRTADDCRSVRVWRVDTGIEEVAGHGA